MDKQRSLAGVVGTVLSTAGGACCVGLGAGGAVLGGTLGATVGWLTPVLLGVALLVLGALLLRARSGHPWRSWHGLAAVGAASYLASALVVVPLLTAVLSAGGQGGEVLP